MSDEFNQYWKSVLVKIIQYDILDPNKMEGSGSNELCGLVYKHMWYLEIGEYCEPDGE